MSHDRRRKIAGYVLVVYLGAIATFQLAHTDYVPLDAGRWLSPASPFANSIDVINGRHICPAQLFAQSTTNIGVVTPHIFVPETCTFFSIRETEAHFDGPISRQTTRAPPLS